MRFSIRNTIKVTSLPAVLALSLSAAPQQNALSAQTTAVPLTVPAGAPLRLYLIHRVPKRIGAPVEAKLLSPVYAFDREVVPAGSIVIGRVSRLDPVGRWERIRFVLGGDFTPLHIAQIEFTSMHFEDGRVLEVHTLASPGLNSLVPLRPPKKASPRNTQPIKNGMIAAARQQAKSSLDAQLDRIRAIPDIVRSPGRKEMIENYAISRLPYHPQYVRSRTRFDAELEAPLQFGSQTFQPGAMALLGSQPAPGTIVPARLLTPLDSLTSKQGEKIEAILEQPLLSADRRLVLPEGTIVEGSVSLVKKAGWFHRGGRLRFSFQNVELTAETRNLLAAPGENPSPRNTAPEFRTQATLADAESSDAPLKVDKEGGVQAKESKARFIGTGLAVLVASRAADNDPIHAPGGAVTGHQPNIGGRTVGGGLGFGLLGSIAAQSSHTVGTALGYYGLAWSVYSTVIARGAEVEFRRNAVIDIAFNQRAEEKKTTK